MGAIISWGGYNGKYPKLCINSLPCTNLHHALCVRSKMVCVINEDKRKPRPEHVRAWGKRYLSTKLGGKNRADSKQIRSQRSRKIKTRQKFGC